MIDIWKKSYLSSRTKMICFFILIALFFSIIPMQFVDLESGELFVKPEPNLIIKAALTRARLAWSLDIEQDFSDSSDDGKLIVCAANDEAVIHLLNSTKSFLWGESTPGIVTCLDMSPSGEYIAVGTETHTALYHKNGTKLWDHASSHEIFSLKISSEGNFITSLSLGGSNAKIFFFNTSEFLWDYDINNPRAIDISDDENCTIAVAYGNQIDLLARNGNLDSTITYSGSTSISSISILPNGTFIGLIDHDGMVGFCDRTHELWLKGGFTDDFLAYSNNVGVPSIQLSQYRECMVFGGHNFENTANYTYSFDFEGNEFWKKETVCEVHKIIKNNDGYYFIVTGYDHHVYAYNAFGSECLNHNLPEYARGISIGCKGFHAVVSMANNFYYFDRFPPDIDGVDDIYYECGTTGHMITWHAWENTPEYYNITIDDVLLEEGPWHGENITINVDGLLYGEYSYKLSLRDMANFSSSESLVVSVTDTANPTINSPNDITYEEGMTDNVITWHPIDCDPASYVILKNTVELESGDWDGEEITINVDGLSPGTNSYLCRVYDNADNANSDSVYVYVEESENPIIDSPTDITYTEESTGNNITWTSSDDFPATYMITRNGTEIENDVWNGNEITISIDGLDPGIYSFKCTVYDKAGNNIMDEVIVTVASLTNGNGPGFTCLLTIFVLISMIPIIRISKKGNK